MNEQNYTNNINTIGVFNANIARHLHLNGYKLVDFKANRANKERTVFYFEKTDALLAALESEKARIAARHEQISEAGVEVAIAD